jgi:hypothetical protein
MFSHEVTFIEKELGVLVTEDYPLMKFLQQLTDLQYFKSQEQKQSERLKKPKR